MCEAATPVGHRPSSMPGVARYNMARSRINQCPHLVVCECRSLLCNRGEADFQIGPHLLHCTRVTKRWTDGAIFRHAPMDRLLRSWWSGIPRVLRSTGPLEFNSEREPEELYEVIRPRAQGIFNLCRHSRVCPSRGYGRA